MTPSSRILTFSGRNSVCKRVKVEDGADAAPALTVARGGSQPWQCPQELKQSGWGTFRVGTSGYVYKHWKKVVYEEGISQKQWFQLYTRLFDSVEINNSFYRLPAPQVFEGWRDQAPSGFCYSLKFSRWFTQVVTHKPAHLIFYWFSLPGHLCQTMLKAQFE